MVDNKIVIVGIEYKIIDTMERMTVPDCFVVSANKIGSGHGEAKFYIKSRNNKQIFDFFGSDNFNVKCFIKKDDLQKYMQDVKEEYLNPDQNYQKKTEFPQLWKKRIDLINKLNDIEYFNLSAQNQIIGERFYVNSDKNLKNNRPLHIGYQILREASLPKITYLAAIKLQDMQGNMIFYFRLFVDYFSESENKNTLAKQMDEIERLNSTDEEKLQLAKARIGQRKYRQKLLELCPCCPVTLVSDDRLLIASHIKPWAKSNPNEKIDPLNGFMFTPNIDWLFDKGFITFTNDKKMLISPWLSKMTCSRLNIIPNKKYDLLPVDGRECYLEYHRKEIFKA